MRRIGTLQISCLEGKSDLLTHCLKCQSHCVPCTTQSTNDTAVRASILISGVSGCPPWVGSQCTSIKGKTVYIILYIFYQLGLIKVKPTESENVGYHNGHTVGESLGGHQNISDSKKWSWDQDSTSLAINKWLEGRMATKDTRSPTFWKGAAKTSRHYFIHALPDPSPSSDPGHCFGHSSESTGPTITG